MTTNWFEQLTQSLRRLDDRGTVEQTDGGLLIRKDPPRQDGLFADAYLHEIYAPLGENELAQLEECVGNDCSLRCGNSFSDRMVAVCSPIACPSMDSE